MRDKNRQRDFIIHNRKLEKKKKKQGSHKQNTLIYSLTLADAKIRFCKDFFLKTLDISEKMARLKSIKSFQTTESHCCPKDTTKAYLEGMLNLEKCMSFKHRSALSGKQHQKYLYQ